MSRVFTGSLRVVCERTHRFRKITGSVNEPKSNDPGMIPGTHYPCIFRNLCVKEALGCFHTWSEPEFVCSPPSPCPRWTVFILFYLGPNRGSFASSSQQLFPPLLSNDGAGECGKMHNIALCTFIYLRF